MRPVQILMMIAIVVCSSFINAAATYSTDCELSLQHVLEYRTNCIREINGDKIYLETQSISISDKGISLQLNESGDFAFIPVLFTDERGCFIRAEFTFGSDYRMGDAANNYKRICPDCGFSYFISCQNKNCIRNNKN